MPRFTLKDIFRAMVLFSIGFALWGFVERLNGYPLESSLPLSACMFGGFGLYQDETFFGVIHKGKLFFKIDQSTVGEYRKRKMKPFRPNANQTLKSYYQVPAEVIEDADELSQWAVKATECQLRNRKA